MEELIVLIQDKLRDEEWFLWKIYSPWNFIIYVIQEMEVGMRKMIAALEDVLKVDIFSNLFFHSINFSKPPFRIISVLITKKTRISQ